MRDKQKDSQTKRNICAIIKRGTSPLSTEPLLN